jgi:hypothetical protein
MTCAVFRASRDLKTRRESAGPLVTSPSLPTAVPIGFVTYLRSGRSVPSLLLGSSSPKITSLALSSSPLSSSRCSSSSLTSSRPSGLSSSVLGKPYPPGTSPVAAPSLGGDSSLPGTAPSSSPDVLGGGASSIPSRARGGSVLGEKPASARLASPIPGSVAAASIPGRPSTPPVAVSSLLGAPAARPSIGAAHRRRAWLPS